jgi:hypothetical protein
VASRIALIRLGNSKSIDIWSNGSTAESVPFHLKAFVCATVRDENSSVLVCVPRFSLRRLFHQCRDPHRVEEITLSHTASGWAPNPHYRHRFSGDSPWNGRSRWHSRAAEYVPVLPVARAPNVHLHGSPVHSNWRSSQNSSEWWNESRSS